MIETLFGFVGTALSCTWVIGLFNIDSLHWNAFFPGSLQYIRVLVGNMMEKEHIQNPPITEKDKKINNYFKQIKDWALKGSNDPSVSTHVWYNDLPSLLRDVVDIIKNDTSVISLLQNIFKVSEYDYIHLDGMNEVYVTGEDRNKENTNSDRVFFVSHIDGPFFFIPFISVYRCLVGLNDNASVTTHFPMIDDTFVVNRGDILAFDYNREVHYITKNDDVKTDEQRVALKLHYCLYPKGWHIIGSIVGDMHVLYNSLLRNLFLKTIRPRNFIENIFSKVVVWSTHLVVYTDIFIGYRNLIYFAVVYWNTVNYSNTIRRTCMLTFPLFYKLLYISVFQTNSYSDVELISVIRDVILFSLLYSSINHIL